MAYQALPCNSDTANPVRTGVLLVNLGTPDAATPSALRRYLAEFLSDPRVIELPRWLWKVILHGIILRTRPAKSAKAYQSVWTEDGSPLLVISRKQQLALQERLGTTKVELGMRYGTPSIAQALRALQKDGLDRLIVLPLYPQYSAPTTGSVFDAVTHELRTWRYVPELHIVQNYFQQSTYLNALANTIREHIAQNGKPQKLIFSYHGMPVRYANAGDPYYQFCLRNTALVERISGLEPGICMTTFQSRFGREEWLQPYTDMTLKKLPDQGIEHIAIISPAFSADCLETLEELAVENRDIFIEHGGKTYHYIPALNDRADHIDALEELITPLLD